MSQIAPKDLPYSKRDFKEVTSLVGLSFDQIRAFSWHNTSRYLKCKKWDISKLCGICGTEIPQFYNATLDHIVPRSAGGHTREHNIRLAHRRCNNNRSSTPEKYTKKVLEAASVPMTKNTPKAVHV